MWKWCGTPPLSSPTRHLSVVPPPGQWPGPQAAQAGPVCLDAQPGCPTQNSAKITMYTKVTEVDLKSG